MHKKTLNFMCLILVLSLAGGAYGGLVAHWALDDGSGSTAKDSAGNNDGTIGGTPNWIAGQVGAGALDFDGATNYIDMDNQVASGTFTLAMWIKPRDIPYTSGYYAVLHNDSWNAGSVHVHLRANTSLFNADINSGPGVTSTTVLQAEQWYHCVLTVTNVGGNASGLYVNGVLEATGSGGGGTPYLGPLNFGAWTNNQRYYHGVMDDIRVYDRVLTDEQITGLYNGIVPTFYKAEEPKPADGSENVGLYENYGLLSWKAGDQAAWHHVYFGTNPTPGAAEFKNRNPLGNTFFFPVREPGTTYYWRIDEERGDGSIQTGDVWWFSTAPLEAHSPSPVDGAKFVDPNADLSWGEGFDSQTHDVYFGTDADAVANATPATTGIFKGNQANTTYELDTLDLETTYYWRVDEKDPAKTVTGDLWSFTTGTAKQGKILREIWRDITPTGTSLDLLKNWWKYPGQPDDVNDLTSFSSPDLGINQYGGRIHGWLHVPSAGEYTFWVAGDDNTELWLSTDEDPGNVELIAEVPGWTSVNQWTKFPEQESEPITLTTGKYYIMALWKEGGGGDHCAVAWQGPPSPERAVIPGAYLSPFEALWAWSPDPGNGDTGVTLQPILTWLPGIHATSHEIYFGTDPDAVANATKASGEYKGPRVLGAESYDPGKLLWETSYYWRIDEVNSLHIESPWEGRVWSFTTSNYLLVDDFEDYNDYPPDRIFEWWLDGFGYGAPPPSPPPYYPGNGTGSI
ncbi:MAG: hypothetical protein JSU94_19320, partial [Phycisphaerales bacterium]